MWEISIIAMSQIIFGIILLSSKKKEVSDYILILWLLILSLPFLHSILNELEISAPILSTILNQSFTLLHGPLLYIYLQELINNKKKKTKYWIHFLIFIIFYIIFTISPAPIEPGGPNGEIEVINQKFSIIQYFGIINVFIFLFYGIISIKSLYTHRLKIKEIFSHENSEITLLWLNLLPILFVVIISIILLFENSSFRNFLQVETLHLLMFYFFSLYLIFFGLKQKPIYPKRENTNQEKEKLITKEKDKKEKVSIENSILLSKMNKIMERDKLYLNPTLSVYDLADALNISRHQISALLNNDLSMNFYQYVNRYRLEEVCKKLSGDNDNKYNLLDHALDAGFNSKSSFNSLFKKQYGITPSQYRKSLKEKTI